MTDKNEMVVIEMVPGARLKLYGQITARMKDLGLNPCDYQALGLGFELPATWPVDENEQPTLSQLAMVAVKLKMRIIIYDMDLLPRK